ncbi:thiamine-phosphate kinase [Maricaulis sp.]|uniref:thiamine-phosphate kinase n=1 Tax=Maricaulis sp. TaxID=1486257 RepID=UPI002B265A30|nr:thiamine-phosphate kinase [Maricaulis sp.]
MAGDGEFDFIRTRLLPLTEGDPAALGLRDDAALLRPEPGHEIVLACDSLVAGVHFLDGDAPAVVAARALRTNLSDLAAMGARPRAYLSAIAWPEALDAPWRTAFVDALHVEQRAFGLALIGGDTTSTPGPLTLSMTLVGEVQTGTAIQRSGAVQGDEVWVSGVIGDGYLGLQAARGDRPDLPGALPGSLARYQAPEPRLGLGQALRGLASAAIDVSDGLLADAGHIATASGCGLVIDPEAVPVSATATAWLGSGGELATLLTGGDDYELLFTVPAACRDRVEALARHGDVALTRIGVVQTGEGAVLRHRDGRLMQPGKAGFTHF